jgi:hypothetical protein
MSGIFANSKSDAYKTYDKMQVEKSFLTESVKWMQTLERSIILNKILYVTQY